MEEEKRGNEEEGEKWKEGGRESSCREERDWLGEDRMCVCVGVQYVTQGVCVCVCA